MPTPDELRADLAAAREEFQSALAGAGDTWEKVPPSPTEGEDSWSPRQVAEHAIGADVYFASEICGACGYPGLELAPLSLASPAEALTALDEAAAKSDGRLKYVSDKDLTMQHKSMGSVADVMAISASHFRDHAQQIQTVQG